MTCEEGAAILGKPFEKDFQSNPTLHPSFLVMTPSYNIYCDSDPHPNCCGKYRYIRLASFLAKVYHIIYFLAGHIRKRT